MKRKEIIPKEKKEGKKKTIKHEVLQITKRIDIHPKIDLQIDIDKLNVRSIQKYKATSRKGLERDWQQQKEEQSEDRNIFYIILQVFSHKAIELEWFFAWK